MAGFDLESIVANLLKAREDQRQYVVAIAGPPASGKSTLSKALSNHLNGINDLRSVVVPMDGFHLDNDRLDDLSLRHRKGAPETFDFNGFATLLRRLGRSSQAIYYPTFDRVLDKAIAGKGVVYPEDQVILVEGNYLLLDVQPWSQLKALFDHSIFINIPIDVLRSRLIQRWLDLDHTPEEAKARALSNDIPNAALVCDGSIKADQLMSLD
ncbi:hypothetical protein N9E48_10120 [Paracoccaceae bacterium]|nr:hypothetical protein [Paracoccaceae bacterium]